LLFQVSKSRTRDASENIETSLKSQDWRLRGRAGISRIRTQFARRDLEFTWKVLFWVGFAVSPWFDGGHAGTQQIRVISVTRK
jgi:hypothetical protein